MRYNGMAIAINGSMLDHQPSGLGIYSINLINHLFLLYNKEENRKLTVFTPSKAFLNPDLKMVKLMNLLQSSRYGKVAAFSRFFWNTFIYPISSRKYDLLISPTTHASFVSPNQILTIHDLLSLRFGNINGHQRLYYKYLLPMLVKRASIIVAVSQATKKDIVKFLNCPEEKVRVVYNGYDQTTFNISGQNPGHIHRMYELKDYFLVVGPTYAHKNIELLIHAYLDMPAALRAKHPLVIAGGKRPYLDVIEQLVIRLGLEQQVHFLGYVPQQYMASLYREARALVFPSLHEGFGFPLLEAMACGCPVIASDTSSIPEICGDAVQYIHPLEKKSMMHAMIKLADHPQLCEQLTIKGLLQVKKFSWEKTAHEMRFLIETHLTNITN